MSNPLTFGALLKQVRKQAGMTQDDLAAATGYSRSLIAALERNQRLPDIEVIIQSYLPALGLQDEPHLAARLVELAALARGERPPSSLTLTRERKLVISTKAVEDRPHLPLPPTALLGRDQAINHLCSRLLGHHGRLLTLVGPPGVGKTRLAQAVATALQPIYPDGAVFVPLAAVSDPALLAASLVTALQLQDGSPKPPQTRLIEYLRRKEMLLVLDNFEQLLPHPSPTQSGEGAERGNRSVGLVAELLAECAGLRLLVTSRERLHLRAEQRYRVPPLDLATAVELFVQRAAAVDIDFALTAANRPLIEAICQRLDRLPLAIELCAVQIDLLAPAQLLTHLQAAPLDLLVAGAHDLPPQQRTLRNAIYHSYRLLNETERTLLRSLGIFVGGFALAEVEAVSGWPPAPGAPSLLTTLHALIGKSLVHTATLPSGEPRFLLLETIREFALEQARAQGEEAQLRQRHYAAYLHLFRTGDRHLRGPEAATWFARLEPEQDNLRAALQWAFDEGRFADAAWLMVIALCFWHLRGYWSEYGRWLTHLLPHRQALPPDLRLTVLLSLYAVARAVEEFQPVDRYTSEVMALLEICPYKLFHAGVWHFMAAYSTDFSQAAAAWERSIALARAADAASGPGAEFGIPSDRDFVLGHSLWSYARRLVERGDFAQTVTLCREGLTLFQARGNRYESADGLGTLGRLALLQGDLAEAHKLLHEAVTISTAFNYQELRVFFQYYLGIVTLYGGDGVEARRLLEESLRLCLDFKDKGFLARACTYLAEIALWEGTQMQAEHWLAQSLDYDADPRVITIFQIERLWVAARLATAQQQYQRAATLFGLADHAHSQIHDAITGPMRTLADDALATVRIALEPALFTEAFAAGQQMSLEEAFASILAPAMA